MRMHRDRTLPLPDAAPASVTARRARNSIPVRTSQLAAAVTVSLIVTGCATGGTGLFPMEAGPQNDLLPVEVTDPADDLLPVEVTDPADDLLPVHVTGAACVPGAWRLDNASWRDVVTKEAGNQPGKIMMPTGAMLIEYSTDGRYTLIYAPWDAEIRTDEGSILMHAEGTDKGKYTVTGSKISMQETSHGSSVQGTVKTPAGSFPLPEAAAPALDEQVPYSCKDDAMTMTTEGGDLHYTRESATER